VSTSPAQPFELPFAKSARSTVGTEWELALIDGETRALCPAAPQVIAVLEGDSHLEHPHIHPEFMQNTIELVSGVHRTVAEAGADVLANARELREITNSLGVGMIGAGTHPFSPWNSQRITDKERYWSIIERSQIVARQIMIFGVHTHVGIETRDKVVPIINSLLVFQPYLLALAASSPFWEGKDTGYASMRSVIFQQLPTAGVPYQFTSWQQLEKYISGLLKTGTIKAFDEVRWDIRPAFHYGTIETRVCDGVSNLRELLALNALTHCLVEYLSTMLDAGAKMPVLPPWFVAENKWRAARYGMDAEVITDANGSMAPLRNQLLDVVAALEPTAQRLECAAELALVPEILELGASYERQRRVHAKAVAAGASERGALEAVVDHLAAEMRADRPIAA